MDMNLSADENQFDKITNQQRNTFTVETLSRLREKQFT